MQKYDPNNKREKIYGVHEKEIDDFFNRINVSEEIRAGEIKCEKCGKTITINNFYALKKGNKKNIFICEDEDCKKKVKKNE